MLGLAERAFAAGWNAVRLNQRNCGGTESLTPTLYNSGLSGDYRAVLFELIEQDSLPEIFFAGYSMGGNLVLKMAGELAGAAPRQLRGVAAVCPSLDLAACADAVALPGNFVYQSHFVSSLKDRMRRKAKLFPGKFDLGRMARVRTLREFDDVITAAYCGFRDAADYYAQSSALRVAGEIRVPALDADRAGRSLRSVRELLRSRAGEKPVCHSDCPRTRRTLRLCLALQRRRAFLGRSEGYGVLRAAFSGCFWSGRNRRTASKITKARLRIGSMPLQL